jgi:hypothetical protein
MKKLLLYCTSILLACIVSISVAADYPVVPVYEMTSSRVSDHGYVLGGVISSVEFPHFEWRRLERRFGNCVIEPVSGVSLCYQGHRFGHRLREFGLWAWSVSEHQWGKEVEQLPTQAERDSRLLSEWVTRALKGSDIQPPHSLAITLPVLVVNNTKAALISLQLVPLEQPLSISRSTVGQYDYARLQVQTKYTVYGDTKRFTSIFYARRFEYLKTASEWVFFAAEAHIPSDLSDDRKAQYEKLFVDTLATVIFKREKGE